MTESHKRLLMATFIGAVAGLIGGAIGIGLIALVSGNSVDYINGAWALLVTMAVAIFVQIRITI